MRAAFGLVGILGVLGVIVFFMMNGGSQHLAEVAKTNKEVRKDVNQLAGNAREGGPTFKESITVDAQSAGGKTVALLVEKVDPAGPAATYFGLKRGDLITDIGYLKVRDSITGDGEGVDFLMDAYQKKQPITVVRDERQITLPGGKELAGQPPAPVQAPSPVKPQDDPSGSLQRQLDNITGAGQKPPGGN